MRTSLWALALVFLVGNSALAGLSSERVVFCKVAAFNAAKVTLGCDGNRVVTITRERMPPGAELKEAGLVPLNLSLQEYKRFGSNKKLKLGSVAKATN